jgi:hypothetical protein
VSGNGDQQVREEIMVEARRHLRRLAQQGATLREIEAQLGPAGLKLNRTERGIALLAAREELRRMDSNGAAPTGRKASQRESDG